MPWLEQDHGLPSGEAARILDFAEILEDCAQRAWLPKSRAALRSLLPLTRREDVDARRERVRAWQQLLESGREPDLDGLVDPTAWLEKSKRSGAQLGAVELRELAGTLRALSRFGRFMEESPAGAAVLAADWGHPAALSPLADEIERCVDEEGQVRDAASSLLQGIRRQIAQAREQVKSRLDALIRERLGGPGEDIRPRIRSGRFVLPVLREQRSRLAGIVHDESATGRTLFVEPLETVELNNQVASLLAEEAKEVSRILRELTRRAGAWADEIQSQTDAFGRLDLPLAVARAWHGRDHCWAEWDAAGALRLLGARHPLLGRYLPAGEKAVPLDLELKLPLRLLLVTGPNTGGKTVMLKTLGLLVLMNQSGLPLPAAEGSRLPLFDRLFVDIGDAQSIQDSRSTFSAHLEQLRRMVEEAGPDSLILVDEIGDGTDPEEGAALAQAIMRHWIERGALAVVSTHFGVLKGFAQETPGAANAAMEFDPVLRRPLYTLRPGIPGSSRALATARRMGMPEAVLAEAEKLLGEEALSLEALLERLEAELEEAGRARRESEALRLRYESLEAEYTRRLAEARQESRRILDEAHRLGEDFLQRSRAELEAVVKELREQQADRPAILKGQERLAELGRELKRLAPPPASPDPLSRWEAGDRVLLRATGRQAEVLGAAGEDRLRVSVGGLSMVLPLSELAPLPPGVPAAEGRAAVPWDPVSYRGDMPDTYRLDLRGLTVEEALDKLDAFLDAAVLGALQFVEILHGKGTGALRRAVHDALASDRRVRRQRLADQARGGSGVTVAVLGDDAPGRPAEGGRA